MEDFLSHENLYPSCDVVFARNIFPDTPGVGDIEIGMVDTLNLKDGDIVYSKFEFIPHLFQALGNTTRVKDLKFISHESDRGVVEGLFQHKPKCISKWYAQNVEYEHEDLIPIPLGLSGKYYGNTHIVTPPNRLVKSDTQKLLYINHRIETYPTARQWIYEHFKTNDWCTVDLPTLTKDQFRDRLINHKFILCPRGNGVDTCRLWESLYYGMIPIVEDHVAYKTLEDLPAIRVPSFKMITEKFLLEQEEKIKNGKFNMDKLKASWWMDKIRKGE